MYRRIYVNQRLTIFASGMAIRSSSRSRSRHSPGFYRVLGLGCNVSHARLVVAGSEDAELPDGCYRVDRAVAEKVDVCDSLYPAYRCSFL